MENFKITNPKLQPFLVSTVIIVVILVLSATFGRYLVNNLLSTQSRIQQLKQENLALSQKKDKLSQLDRNVLAQKAQATVFAIPTQDSGIAALSTIRSKAFVKNVQLVSIRVSQSETQGKNNEVFLKFEVSGPLSNIIALIDSLESSAPILRVSKVHMLGGSSQLSADVDLSTYWAELTQKTPDTKAPLDVLTKKEEDLVSELEKLEGGSTSAIAPAPAVGKENPFVQ